jgi:hypothetical protein
MENKISWQNNYEFIGKQLGQWECLQASFYFCFHWVLLANMFYCEIFLLWAIFTVSFYCELFLLWAIFTKIIE